MEPKNRDRMLIPRRFDKLSICVGFRVKFSQQSSERVIGTVALLAFLDGLPQGSQFGLGGRYTHGAVLMGWRFASNDDLNILIQ